MLRAFQKKNTWGWGGGEQGIYFSIDGWCKHFYLNYMGRWCLTKSDYMGGWLGSISNSAGGGWLFFAFAALKGKKEY